MIKVNFSNVLAELTVICFLGFSLQQAWQSAAKSGIKVKYCKCMSYFEIEVWKSLAVKPSEQIRVSMEIIIIANAFCSQTVSKEREEKKKHTIK